MKWFELNQINSKKFSFQKHTIHKKYHLLCCQIPIYLCSPNGPDQPLNMHLHTNVKGYFFSLSIFDRFCINFKIVHTPHDTIMHKILCVKRYSCGQSPGHKKLSKKSKYLPNCLSKVYRYIITY
jgi:hypothetical protein